MALGRWTGTVQDEQGNAVAGALIEVRRESSGALEPLFSDRDGTVGLANPFTASDATIFFHAAGGAFRVKATLGGFERIWRYVGVGTAGELDADTLQDLIAGGLARAVSYDEQDVLPEDQEQARLNIGAVGQDELDDGLDGVLALVGARKLAGGTVTPGAASLDIPLTGYSAYSKLIVRLRELRPSIDSSRLLGRFLNGATLYSAGYAYKLNAGAAGSTVADSSVQSTSDTSMRFGWATGSDTGEHSEFTLELLTWAVADLFPMVKVTASEYYNELLDTHGSAALTTATAVDTLRLFYNTGNIARGKYEVYGHV